MINEQAPSFTLDGSDGNKVSLEDMKGKWVVLYFYPKDDTPGCTIEARDFSSKKDQFESLNCEILGVSQDTIEKHCKFIDKYKLKIKLLTDSDGEVCKKYGVLVEKNMYGKKYIGIERTTFLLNPDSVIVKVWNKVKAEDHADEVANYLKRYLLIYAR
jgi:peroxiredoxin Q/BCP